MDENAADDELTVRAWDASVRTEVLVQALEYAAQRPSPTEGARELGPGHG